MRIGIMQGRLTPSINNKIQFFPWNNWKNEFALAFNKVNLIEWTIDEFNINKNPIFNNKNLIRELSEIHDIKVESVTCDFLMENPFYKNKKQKIDSLLYLNKLIESSISLNIKYLIFPLVDNGSIGGIQEEENLISSLIDIQSTLQNNLKIIFESDYNPKKLHKFIKNFDLKNFGINYDTGNSASLGYDLEEEMGEYFNFIDNIHIKDRNFNSKTVRLGSGSFKFTKFFKLIKKRKYKGNLILQTARGKNYREIQTLDYNLKFLNRYLNGA